MSNELGSECHPKVIEFIGERISDAPCLSDTLLCILSLLKNVKFESNLLAFLLKK